MMASGTPIHGPKITPAATVSRAAGKRVSDRARRSRRRPAPPTRRRAASRRFGDGLNHAAVASPDQVLASDDEGQPEGPDGDPAAACRPLAALRLRSLGVGCGLGHGGGCRRSGQLELASQHPSTSASPNTCTGGRRGSVDRRPAAPARRPGPSPPHRPCRGRGSTCSRLAGIRSSTRPIPPAGRSSVACRCTVPDPGNFSVPRRQRPGHGPGWPATHRARPGRAPWGCRVPGPARAPHPLHAWWSHGPSAGSRRPPLVAAPTTRPECPGGGGEQFHQAAGALAHPLGPRPDPGVPSGKPRSMAAVSGAR